MITKLKSWSKYTKKKTYSKYYVLSLSLKKRIQNFTTFLTSAFNHFTFKIFCFTHYHLKRNQRERERERESLREREFERERERERERGGVTNDYI